MTMFDLDGKTALVTGSSRGLGRAFAEGLALAGARVVLNGMDTKRLEQAAGELRAAGCTADPTSCRTPGGVRPAVRTPPPMALEASSTWTS